MGKIKFGRALGLSLLSALSLMAVFAVSAQATADPGEYWVGELGKFLLATATGTQEGTGTLLVPGRNLSLNCTTGTVNKGHLATSKEATGEVTFSGCTALEHESPFGELECKVDEPIVATAKLTPFLHLEAGKAAKLYVTAEPIPPATIFAKVVLLDKTAGSCAIKNTYEVKGKVSAEVKPALEEPAHPVVNLLSLSPTFSTLVADTLKFGAFPATVKANVEISLTGAHAGVKFGVV